MTAVYCTTTDVNIYLYTKNMSSRINWLKNNNFIFTLYFYLIFSILIVSFYEPCDTCTGSYSGERGFNEGPKNISNSKWRGKHQGNTTDSKGHHNL